MKNKIVLSGVIAALYAVLTVLFSFMSFGAIQLRIADVLLIMCVANPTLVMGVAMGAAIANMASPLGPIDILVGFVVNGAIGLIASKTKSDWATVLSGTLIVATVVGLELSVAYELPIWGTMLSVGIGELLSLAIGLITYRAIKTNKYFMKYINKNR